MVAKLGQPLELPVEHAARIAGEGIAVRIEDPADHAGGRVFARLPGDDREGREIGHQVHVGFGDAGESGDRGAVDPLAAFDDVLEDAGRNRDALDDAHDIGELEIDEPDLLALDAVEDLFLGRSRARELLHRRSTGIRSRAHSSL